MTLHRTFLATVLTAALAMGSLAAHAKDITLLNVSYDPTRELYQSSSSSSRICRLTPGCEVWSALATSVRLKPRRTASRTERSCWKFMDVISL
jgi:hypothetical protein